MRSYVVGGAVRDELLGRPVTDRDHVVVGATPQDMLEQGFYLATRGMLALSLEVGDTELDSFATAVEGFVRRRGALLAGS